MENTSNKKKNTEINIYSIGYKNVLPSELSRIVDDLDATLIDIRYAPTSFSPFWKKDFLQGLYNDKYLHIKDLGNINFNNNNDIKILDLERGIDNVLNGNFKNVIFMCACEDLNECHRKIIKEYLMKKYSIEMVEIDNDFLSENF